MPAWDKHFTTRCVRLYRWIRVYDDCDSRNRIEQMVEWAEGEDDPESFEIPKREQDLPSCLKDKPRSDNARLLTSFPVPAVPWLRELVMIKQQMQFHRALGAPVLRPVKDRGTEFDQRGIQAQQFVLEAEAMRAVAESYRRRANANLDKSGK